jgi:hypothetical protein
VESLAGRLEFNERRARSLESVVAYRPAGEDRSRTAAASEPRPIQEPVSREPVSREPASREPVSRELLSREPLSREPAPSVEIAGAPAPVAAGEGAEGPGQRSRRRRRRRGRRSGAPAAGVMGGPTPVDANVEAGPVADGESDGSDEGGTDADDLEPILEFDQRMTRPEPIEQAFGAEVHPAEPAVADPATSPGPAPDRRSGGADEPQ